MTTTPTMADLSARELMGVISSASIEDLGRECQAALERHCSSPAMGIYLLRDGRPELLFSSDVPVGFLAEYATLYSASDPLIQGLSRESPVTDGRSCLGEANWRQSERYEFMRSWGLGDCMCGLIPIDRTTLGIIYSASPAGWQPPHHALDQMGYLCRGAGIALRDLIGPRPEGRGDLPPQLARVAALICEGRSNKDIARAVGLSDHTIKEYVQRLAQRFGADNRTALAVALLRHGYQGQGL